MLLLTHNGHVSDAVPPICGKGHPTIVQDPFGFSRNIHLEHSNFALGGDNKASSLGPHYIQGLQIGFNTAHLSTVVNRGCLPSKLVNAVTNTLKAA
jgi:hypothetical protein